MEKGVWSEIIAAPLVSLSAALVGASLRIRNRTKEAAAGIKSAKSRKVSSTALRNENQQRVEEQRRALDEQRALLQETDYDDLETKFALLTAARTLLGQEIAAERELLDSLVELDEATWAFITLFEENNQLAKDRINALLSKRPPGHYVPDTYRSSVNASSYPANQFDWSPI